MCNIVHTCIKKYTVAVLYSCKFCTAHVFLFLADHETIQFTNIHKIRRYLGTSAPTKQKAFWYLTCYAGGRSPWQQQQPAAAAAAM